MKNNAATDASRGTMGKVIQFDNEWIITLLGKEAAVKHIKFGAFLKRAREKKKLSQWEVARLVGYSTPQFISNLERGVSPPPLKVLKILVKAYEVDPKIVIKIIEEEQRKNLKKNLAKISKALR
jgi:ribosome-binding protein aMBF1 (putative translation factor)